jgi:hypothetical protein
MHFSYRKMSVRRIVAMAIAIGCHLGLLTVMLRPDTHRTDVISVTRDDAAKLELRFISPPRAAPTAPASATAHEAVAPPKTEVRPRPVLRTARRLPPPSTPVASDVATPPAAPAPPTDSPSPPSATAQTAAPETNRQAPMGDGGFRDRLMNAQRAGDVRGVPGSDTRAAPGIQLTNPMDQGVGSVMRSTQRLFGITNHHCIDVEVWEHLTPDELSARHLTPEDVKKEAEKYNCNRPLGLSI